MSEDANTQDIFFAKAASKLRWWMRNRLLMTVGWNPLYTSVYVTTTVQYLPSLTFKVAKTHNVVEHRSQHQHHSTDDEVITMTTISMTTNIIITNITTVKGNSTDKPRHDVTFHQQQQLSLVTTSRNVVQQHWRHAVSLNTPEQHLIAVNPSNVIKSNNECCNVSLTTMLHFHSATLLAGIICKMCCFHL